MEPLKKRQKHICKFVKTCKTLENRYPPYKKFSQIKRMICEFTLISESNGRRCFAPMGTAGYIYEKERQLNRYSHMIHPYSKFRQFWEGLVIFETLISILVRPFFVSQFGVEVFFSKHYQISALILDLIEMTDVVLEFVTGYVNRETRQVVLETRQVVLHNFQKVSFYFTFISTLPFDFLIYTVNNDILTFPFFRCFIYLKIFRLIKTYRYFVHVAKLHNWSHLMFHLVLNCYNLTLIINLLTSSFYTVIFLDDFGPPKNFFESSDAFSRHIVIFQMVCSILFFKNGLLSYLKIITLKDMFFSSLLLLVTSILQAICFGIFVKLFCYKKTSFIYYQEILQEVHRFIKEENLPQYMRKKIFKYFEFRFRGRYFREKSILQTLSPPLRKEIAIFLCRDFLTESESIFKDIPDELASDLCHYMRYEIFLPGDDVIRSGKIASKIYFVSCGSFSVHSTSGTEIYHLYNGAQFGEAAFSSHKIHPVTVLALEMSECYTLKYVDFITCATNYTEYVSKVTKMADKSVSRGLITDT